LHRPTPILCVYSSLSLSLSLSRARALSLSHTNTSTHAFSFSSLSLIPSLIPSLSSSLSHPSPSLTCRPSYSLALCLSLIRLNAAPCIPRHHGDPLRVQTRISILEYQMYHAFSDLKRPEATPMASASSLQARAVSKRLQAMLSLPQAVCKRPQVMQLLPGAVLEAIGSDAIALEATGSHPIASGYNVYPAFMIMYTSKILYCSYHTHTHR
jgi:hypothetical protein